MLQCQETWLVGGIPVQVREKLNLPNNSKGIDGVYKTMLGEYVPYQVKFRSNRPTLGYNEVAEFLGITEKATDRLLITNCDTIAIDVKNRTGIRSLRGVDFDQLTAEDFMVIENWLNKKPVKRKPLMPDPYQVEALSNIAACLDKNDRGTVVMACGTGKTLVALWAVEQSKAKTILVLVPSLTLMQQTLEEWSVHNSWGKDFSYLCVCSDPQVDLKNDDAIEIDANDLPFRIDTDPEIVKNYLGQENGKIKIVFSTYQSSQVVSQATRDVFEFDIGIFDEAHKTTGSSEGRFSLALKDENIKIRKRIFLTATPKHYDISKRDKHGEFKVSSMDDERVYGRRAHTLTFGNAAAKGIICPYKVVITLIDKHQVNDFALKNGITLVEGDEVKAKWVASQIGVSSSINHTNATKVITFHGGVNNAKYFETNEYGGIKKFLNHFEVFHVNGKQKSNERKDLIAKFRNAPRSLITNAKCLTEGVDVPAVDMVAFVDPRHSKIDIAQAVGRAMRKPRGGDKKVGYIVVPIFAGNLDDQSIAQALEKEDFDDVASILNSLMEQDEELVEIIRELKQAKGRDEIFNPKRLKEKVEVIGPIVGLNELTNSIYVETVDRLGESWDEWCGKLIKFKQREGHTNVHQNHIEEGFRLGGWVSTQRGNRSILSIERINRLAALGFIWDPLFEKWESGFSALLKFKVRHGNCLVRQGHSEDGFKLGMWVGMQRTNKHLLDSDRLNRLELLGFEWNAFDVQWQRRYDALVRFSLREGHCNTPIKHVEDQLKIGQWASQQRTNKSKLSEYKINLLNDLKFNWNTYDELWETGFDSLLEFKKVNGNCDVSRDYFQGKHNLGNWVRTQRSNKEKLSQLQIQRMNSIGFNWTLLDSRWDHGLKLLSKYKLRTGDCLVPQRHKEDGFQLGIWVANIRKKPILEDDRMETLNDIGFIWDVLSYKWQMGFQALIAFKKREAHCGVPGKHIENGYKLGQWVGVQRYERDDLSDERRKLLDEIGFNWVAK
jgi:superfamily II DNA or RNA helicase